jgi:hypothetical protein
LRFILLGDEDDLAEPAARPLGAKHDVHATNNSTALAGLHGVEPCPPTFSDERGESSIDARGDGAIPHEA